MARKPNDTVQVNLRVPEWLRLDVLRRSEKSGRSFNGELTRLIQEGMARPKTAALINAAVEKAMSRMTQVAEIAAAEAAVRMALTLLPALEETPQGRETKAIAVSGRSPERTGTVTVAVPAVPEAELEWPRQIASLERALNDEKDPQEREKLRRLIEFSKERERNFRARAKTASPQGEEK